MKERFDAAVIGSTVSGLAAAALLARAGLRTVLCERSESLVAGGGNAALRALDPALLRELRLTRHGLRFAQRDLALTMLRSGSQPLSLPRDRQAATRALAALSKADAAAYAVFRRERLALARALRPAWWAGAPLAGTAAKLKPAQRARVARLSVASAAAWLSATFESDALKAALAFDAAAVGFAPSEPGSALALLWSAAQEMSGLQGAVAIPRGGSGALLQALAEAAQHAGADLRTSASVAALHTVGNSVAGVDLASGEQIEASIVVSALPRRLTLETLAPTALIGLGAAAAQRPPAIGGVGLVMSLNRSPEFGGAATLGDKRIVVAEKLETYETALAAARLGRMPEEPVLELVLPSVEKTAHQLGSRLPLHARVWPVPLGPAYDREALIRTVTQMIERHVPGFGGGIASCDAAPPDAYQPSLARLSAAAETRVATAIRGLYVCGSDTEPADATSGRSARHAARAAIAYRRNGATA